MKRLGLISYLHIVEEFSDALVENVQGEGLMDQLFFINAIAIWFYSYFRDCFLHVVFLS